MPTVRASARTAHCGHLTKSGSGHARRVLVEAAHVAIRLPGPARHRYLSLFRRRGSHLSAVEHVWKLGLNAVRGGWGKGVRT